MNWKFWKKNKIVVKAEPIEELVKHPCSSDNCLVRMACTKACDKIIMDDHELMKEFLKYNSCADCGSESFMEGPSGGSATNVKCNGCGHWFNFGLPLFIQRIHVDRSSGRFL